MEKRADLIGVGLNALEHGLHAFSNVMLGLKLLGLGYAAAKGTKFLIDNRHTIAKYKDYLPIYYRTTKLLEQKRYSDALKYALSNSPHVKAFRKKMEEKGTITTLLETLEDFHYRQRLNRLKEMRKALQESNEPLRPVFLNPPPKVVDVRKTISYLPKTLMSAAVFGVGPHILPELIHKIR